MPETIPHNHNRLGWVGQGPKTRILEDRLCQRFAPSRECVVVSSGTVALALSLRVLGCNKGPVKLPTYACSALAYAALTVTQPGWIDLVDVVPVTFNAAEDVTIGVHTYGAPCNVNYRIEDFTHAVGGFIKGQPCGSFGELSVVSFGASKPLGVGQGGAVLGPSTLIARIRELRDSDTGPYDYIPGRFNHQLSDVMSAMVLDRLDRLDEENEWRRATGTTYLQAYSGEVHGVTPRLYGSVYDGTWYRFVIRVQDVWKAKQHFSSRFIETINPLRPRELLHKRSNLVQRALPNAEHIAASTLSLPIWPTMTKDQVNRVADALASL